MKHTHIITFWHGQDLIAQYKHWESNPDHTEEVAKERLTKVSEYCNIKESKILYYIDELEEKPRIPLKNAA